MSLRSPAVAPVRFGVLGGASFVANAAVLPAIDAAPNAELTAIATNSGALDERWASHACASYDDVLAADIDAVYIPLPNGLHETWIEAAARAGKHVLCEKPVTPDAAAATRLAATCDAAGVLLAEAWMTPFGRHWATIDQLVEGGGLGELTAIDAAFRFTIGPENAGNYRWDPRHGGGALLDVGIYTLGYAVHRWGADPSTVEVTARSWREHPSGAGSVDSRTDATLRWPGGQTATISCSFVDAEAQRLSLTGTAGTVACTDFDGGVFTGGDPYRPMVQAFADAVCGVADWPRPMTSSIEMLTLLDRIAATEVSS